MFRAGLLLVISRYYSVYTVISIRNAFMLAGSELDCLLGIDIFNVLLTVHRDISVQ